MYFIITIYLPIGHWRAYTKDSQYKVLTHSQREPIEANDLRRTLNLSKSKPKLGHFNTDQVPHLVV